MMGMGFEAEGSKVSQEDLDAINRKRQRVDTNSAQEMDVTRLRQKGADALNRLTPGTSIDRGAINGSRRLVMGSLAGLDNAARGETADMRMLDESASGAAPSRSELVSRQGMNQALRSQVGSMGAVRGGGGAAFRGSLPGMAAQHSNMVGSAQAARAAEMGQARAAYAQAMGAARGAYGQGATAARGEDIRLATDQANLDAKDRAGARGQEQFYERLAFDQRTGDLENRHLIEETEDEETRAKRRREAMDREAEWAATKDAAAAGAGLVSGVGTVLSDRRTKNVIPMGSLAGLWRE